MRCRQITGRSGVRLLGSWIIAALGAYDQLPVTLGVRVHMNRAEAALADGFGGVIANGVLLPDILRALSRNFIPRAQIFWKKGDPAGLVGQHLQRPASAAGFAASSRV